MSAPPVLLAHPSSLDHVTGPHPEQPARISAIDRELTARDDLGFVREQSPAATIEQLTAIHPERHVEFVRRAAASGGGQIDADTIVSPGSYAAAAHAAGGAVALVDQILDGRAPSGFSLHRPPGHHAEAGRAMGFCLFNNIAVAARHALDTHGIERVLIVDWDVHHGNGTNDIFTAEPRVLFTSIHQSPLYPGSGPATDHGSGEGRGFTVNLPVEPGAGDAEFRSLIDHVITPIAATFGPHLVLVSAGFDAHQDDPLADCRVTEAGFAAMTRSVCALARAAGAPVGLVLEGGYGLDGLARSVAATMEVLAADAAGLPDAGSSDAVVPVARVAELHAGRQAEFWSELA